MHEVTSLTVTIVTVIALAAVLTAVFTAFIPSAIVSSSVGRSARRRSSRHRSPAACRCGTDVHEELSVTRSAGAFAGLLDLFNTAKRAIRFFVFHRQSRSMTACAVGLSRRAESFALIRRAALFAAIRTPRPAPAYARRSSALHARASQTMDFTPPLDFTPPYSSAYLPAESPASMPTRW